MVTAHTVYSPVWRLLRICEVGVKSRYDCVPAVLCLVPEIFITTHTPQTRSIHHARLESNHGQFPSEQSTVPANTLILSLVTGHH